MVTPREGIAVSFDAGVGHHHRGRLDDRDGDAGRSARGGSDGGRWRSRLTPGDGPRTRTSTRACRRASRSTRATPPRAFTVSTVDDDGRRAGPPPDAGPGDAAGGLRAWDAWDEYEVTVAGQRPPDRVGVVRQGGGFGAGGSTRDPGHGPPDPGAGARGCELEIDGDAGREPRPRTSSRGGAVERDLRGPARPRQSLRR